MRIEQGIIAAVLVTAFVTVNPGFSASIPGTAGAPAQMVVTMRPTRNGPPANLEAGELTVLEGAKPAPVVRLERLAGSLADMQLFILLDDSTRSSSLSLQLPELKTFLESLPVTTQVAIGYMRNGTFALAQPFTADHQQAARTLRLPMAVPGENGSPYFVLSDLVKHWPSNGFADRRAVLMLTDGVDRYYGGPPGQDPYVDAAIHDSLKQGVLVYTIYLRGAGLYGRSAWGTNNAQSRLIEVSEQTGGYAYFEGLSDPVTISPFLNYLRGRLDHQYRVTIQALNGKSVQPVKLRTESRGLKVSGPTRVYVP